MYFMRICRFMMTQDVTKALILEGIPYCATENAFSIPRTRKCRALKK